MLTICGADMDLSPKDICLNSITHVFACVCNDGANLIPMPLHDLHPHHHLLIHFMCCYRHSFFLVLFFFLSLFVVHVLLVDGGS